MPTTRFYKMRARDANSVPISPPTWRTWVVPEEPDPSAARYTGPFSPPAINFDNVSIASSWVEVTDERWINPVRAATTAPLSACTWTLSTQSLESNANVSINPVDTSVTLVAGNRLLVKNEASAQYNGVYDVIQVGVAGVRPWKLTRSEDQNSSAQVVCGVTLQVEEGDDNGDKAFRISTANPIALNVDPIAWVVSGGGSVALVSVAAAGTARAMGTEPNTIFCSGAPTSGGSWSTEIRLGEGTPTPVVRGIAFGDPGTWSITFLGATGDTAGIPLVSTIAGAGVIVGDAAVASLDITSQTATIRTGTPEPYPSIFANENYVEIGRGNSPPLVPWATLVGGRGEARYFGELALASRNMFTYAGTAQAGWVVFANPTTTAVPTKLHLSDGGDLFTPPENSSMTMEFAVTAKELNASTSASWSILAYVNRGALVRATDTLNVTSPLEIGDVLTVGSRAYVLVTAPPADVDLNVAIGATLADTLQNMLDAINLTGTPGTQYAASTVIHPTVNATGRSATRLFVEAKTGGTVGNSIPVDYVPSGAGVAAWVTPTLQGGLDAIPVVHTIKTVVWKDDAAWDINVSAVDNDLSVYATGKLATTIQWVASARYVQTFWLAP